MTSFTLRSMTEKYCSETGYMTARSLSERSRGSRKRGINELRKWLIGVQENLSAFTSEFTSSLKMRDEHAVDERPQKKLMTLETLLRMKANSGALSHDLSMFLNDEMETLMNEIRSFHGPRTCSHKFYRRAVF